MKRIFSSSRVSVDYGYDEGEEPMSGVANLADIMLVLAVGIMLALVINWNIDVTPGSSYSIDTAPAIGVEIEGFGESDDTEIPAAVNYEKMDVEVYRDPSTGKLYMVEK